MSKTQKFALLVVILLAIFFRFYQISRMPGGLFPDEAANGLDVNLMQQGHLQPFYERGNGREALFFYMEWGSTVLLGKGQMAMHATSALVGVLSVLMCFLVTFRIFLLDLFLNKNKQKIPEPDIIDEQEKIKKRAINIALLAAFLMAVSSWYVVISRTAFRANLIPLVASLTIYFLLRTYQSTTRKQQLIFAALTGASFALGFYTYIAFRIMVAILFTIIAWPWLGSIRNKQFLFQLKKYFLPALLFVLAFIVVFLPIGKYFYDHPGSFIGRAGQVSIFNQTLYTVDGIQLQNKPPLMIVVSVLAEVSKTQFLGFFTAGDLNWRQNISGYPMISQLISPFFAIGLLLCIWFAIRYFFAPNKKSAWWKYFLLLVWFGGMFLPVVSTAEGIPHGLRGVGMIPAVFILSAWVLYEFGSAMYALHNKIWDDCWCHATRDKSNVANFHPHSWRKIIVGFALKAVVVVFLIACVTQTYYLYFVYAANSPEYYYAFRSDLTTVSQYLVQRCNKEHTYLVLDKFSVQTTDYLTSDPKGNFSNPCSVPYLQVDPENSWQLSGLKPGDEVVFTQSSVFDTKKFKQYHPEAWLSKEYRNPQFGETLMAVYKIGNK